MPPPKKAAKKAAKKHTPDHESHHSAKDLRRAYEHLGRVQILGRLQPAAVSGSIDTLASLAQNELRSGNPKDAADLLRGSEHLAFAALAVDGGKSATPSAELAAAILEQFEELSRKAEEHWEHREEHSEALAAIYTSSRKSAVRALKDGSFHQALEFARAAEALAHVKAQGAHRLKPGEELLKLAV